MDYSVVIPAAGQGKRMGAGVNKLLLPLCGKPIIAHTIARFLSDERCKEIVLVISKQDEEAMRRVVESERVRFVYGGKERQQSVFAGVCALESQAEIVLVHDGARPFVSQDVIHRLVAAVNNGQSAIVGVPLKDTIKRVRESRIEKTIDRTVLYAAQTPQAFSKETLRALLQRAENEGWLGTDEASVAEYYSEPVAVVEGNHYNIKLTTPEDLTYGTYLLSQVFPGNKQ
ncbi:MAG: 2-C-methyl-D-erythritol 4-phosphate cytidylyltransferase [Bacilli bacterium]